MYETKARVWGSGAKLIMNGVEQPREASLFADDTVLLAESKSELQKAVDEFQICLNTRSLH